MAYKVIYGVAPLYFSDIACSFSFPLSYILATPDFFQFLETITLFLILQSLTNSFLSLENSFCIHLPPPLHVLPILMHSLRLQDSLH